MTRVSKSMIRRLVIQEHYRSSLVEQLYEQAEPTPPADPAAAPPPPPPDPTAAAAPDPTAAAVPPADPTAAAAPVDPTAAAADPLAALGAPAAAPPADPTAAATPGAPMPPAPGAETPKDEPKKEPPGGTAAAAIEKAGQAAIAAASGDLAVESLRRRSLRFLMEQEEKEPKIDIEVYAAKIANLIKNYTSLIDIKKNVIDQAEKFLDTQFPKNSKDLKKSFIDLLGTRYHISLERSEEPEAPLAIGATKAGGGGAG